MRFEYYTIIYDHNSRRTKEFNIFDNASVHDDVEKAVKRYIRYPSKYEVSQFKDRVVIYHGFEALCAEIRSILMNQFWSRYEYEFSIGDPFATDLSTLEKHDVFNLLEKNIEPIAREVIYQYKQQIKH